MGSANGKIDDAIEADEEDILDQLSRWGAKTVKAEEHAPVFCGQAKTGGACGFIERAVDPLQSFVLRMQMQASDGSAASSRQWSAASGTVYVGEWRRCLQSAFFSSRSSHRPCDGWHPWVTWMP